MNFAVTNRNIFRKKIEVLLCVGTTGTGDYVAEVGDVSPKHRSALTDSNPVNGMKFVTNRLVSNFLPNTRSKSANADATLCLLFF
jgi:hypothetical protein